MEWSEQLAASENTNQSKRDLSISYSRVADIYTKLGGKDNLQKALELYKKALELSEKIIQSEQNVVAYDSLVAILYKVAVHQYTDGQTKRQLLDRGLKILKMLYDNWPSEKYEKVVRAFERELKNMDE